MFCTKNGRLLKFLLLAIKFNRLVKLKSARRCSVSPSFDAGHRAPGANSVSVLINRGNQELTPSFPAEFSR